MTEREIILAQRKHYADAIEKCARLCDAEGLNYLSGAIREIARTTGLEVLKLNVFDTPILVRDVKKKKEDDRPNYTSYSCIPGYHQHSFRSSNTCSRCGAKRYFGKKEDVA